jgi:agmatinase
MKEFFYSQEEPFNFLGLDEQDYEKSKIVIFPVPYSSTTYWKAGTKDGPQAIIEASRHIELYDIETKKEASAEGIFTAPFLEPSKNSPKETISRIETATSEFLNDKKLPLMLGGEHSITLGAVLSCQKNFTDFSVLQIDAHSDLRDEYQGTKYHHACVMKRIRDLGIPVTQVGIRSMSKEESEYVKKENIKNIFFAPEIPVDEIIATLKENVYLTFDLDAFDTSIMPSTGTPEPGGLEWYPVLNLIKEMAKKKKIIGVDVVELDPIPGITAPDFLAAKLVYKIISYVFSK